MEIVHSVLHNQRTSVAGCVACGKTRTAAMAILAFLNAFYPAKAFALAPKFLQVKIGVFAEIHAIHANATVPIGGEMLDTHLKLNHEWYAMGLAAKDPNRLHGIHGENILIVIEEGQGVADDIFEAADNIQAGGNARILNLFNPTSRSGVAYESVFGTLIPYWKSFRIAAADTPNFKKGGRRYPQLIQPKKVDEWIKIYGWDSNFVRVKVRCLPPKQEDDALIPFEWIELAMHREVPQEAEKGEDPLETDIGVDVARFGHDNSAIVRKKGRQILEPEEINGMDTMKIAGKTATTIDDNKPVRTAKIDTIGVGAGVYDRLGELDYDCIEEYIASATPRDPDRFFDFRSEKGWQVREALDPDGPAPIALPKSLKMQAQLSIIKYSISSDKKIKIESKKDTRKRLKTSPDIFDGVCMVIDADKGGEDVPSVEVKDSGATGRGVGFTRLSDRMGRGGFAGRRRLI